MSLLHVSINARDQQRVAEFLGRILGGKAMPFPPFPNCWIAFTHDDDGSAIEVYPNTHELRAGEHQITCEIGRANADPTFVHVAISSPLLENQILDLAEAENWLARTCNRGPFKCVEVWLENRLLIEVLDPVMQKDYRNGMTMENWANMFGFE